MKVLVACEYSGVVRDAFLDCGCQAVSCDLLPSESDRGEHYKGDVRDILNDGWDMLIAFPPCTYLTAAGAVRMYPGGKLNFSRYLKGLEAADFFRLMLSGSDISRVCVENPRPMRIFNLPPCSQVVQPFEFGEPYSKRTYLWLQNLPRLKPTCRVRGVESCRVADWFNKGGKDRQKKRSKTFAGIAAAMASQWSDVSRLPPVTRQTFLEV